MCLYVYILVEFRLQEIFFFKEDECLRGEYIMDSMVESSGGRFFWEKGLNYIRNAFMVTHKR